MTGDDGLPGAGTVDTGWQAGGSVPPAIAPASSRMASLLPALVGGLVVGVVEIVIEVSFAALIFSGDLAPFLPEGTSILLFSAVVVTTAVALLTGVPGMIAVPQDTVAAVTALMATSIAAQLPGGGREAFLTVIAAIVVTSLTLGVVFFALGALKLGNLTRFVPYPVVGGFLAGTGWLLLEGSLGVMTDLSIAPSDVPELASRGVVAKWLPAALFAALLLLTIRRFTHFMLIPGAVFGAIVAFYAVVLGSGATVAEAEAGGWLLGPFASGPLWRPLTVEAVGGADWSAVAAQLGKLATLPLLGVVALLLNASAVELAAKRDADLNRELRVAGIANLLSGLAGGIAGYHALSLSALGARVAGYRRAVGLTAAAVCAAALLSGTAVLQYFPRPVLGGLLFFLGLAFLTEWLYDARRRLPPADYLIVVLIVVVIGTLGFLQGVAVGLAAALVLFVVKYSRTNLVKHSLTGETYRSKVDRPAVHRQLLRERGRGVHILELQGFVFFGTANTLLSQTRERIGEGGMLRFIVLDFRAVTGLDSSAVLSFEKVHQLAASHGIGLVFTNVPPVIRSQFEQAGLRDGAGVSRFFTDLDHGVEWCEDRILWGERHGSEAFTGSFEGVLEGALAESVDVRRLRRYLEPFQLRAGEFLMRQGEASDGLFFIESGRMTVLLELGDGRSLRLRRVMAGTVVGEVGLYLREPRSSSVVAEEACTLYRLTAESLERMKAKDPKLAAAFHQFVARLTAERLVDANRALEALLR